MPSSAAPADPRVARTDSKLEDSTCHGFNQKGAHCRNALPKGTRPGPLDLSNEALYCSHHKDQAKRHAAPKPQAGMTVVVERSSLDTLAERLGIMAIQDPKPQAAGHHHPGRRRRPRRRGRSLLCWCLPLTLDEEDEIPEPAPRPHRPRPAQELIPRTLPPKTIASIEKEIAEGFSPADKPGFIYIFWLTATNTTGATDSGGAHDPADHHSTATTLLLKIGRAANVQQRMKQWSHQCGYGVQLLRFYPHVASAAAGTAVEPMPTPHADKVESLVHKELTGMGMRAPFVKCDGCGVEHREWFTMEYTRASVQMVDDVIRKWIEWDAKQSLS